MTIRFNLPHWDRIKVSELKDFAAACEFCGQEEITFDKDDYFDSPHLEAEVDEEKYNQFLEQLKP